jgi:hypothetical protein
VSGRGHPPIVDRLEARHRMGGQRRVTSRCGRVNGG